MLSIIFESLPSGFRLPEHGLKPLVRPSIRVYLVRLVGSSLHEHFDDNSCKVSKGLSKRLHDKGSDMSDDGTEGGYSWFQKNRTYNNGNRLFQPFSVPFLAIPVLVDIPCMSCGKSVKPPSFLCLYVYKSIYLYIDTFILYTSEQRYFDNFR